LAAGFLISPIVFHNSDMVDFYRGEINLRPGSCAIVAADKTETFWQPEINYRIYAVQSKLGRCAPPEMARLKFPGFQVAPEIKVTAGGAGLTTIGGDPAFVVFPGGSLNFTAPKGATNVTGSFGFPEVAYLQGKTGGAEFRVEATASNGPPMLLFHQSLEPRTRAEDRGFKHFSVAIPADGGETITLHSESLSPVANKSDLTSWAEVRFN
jgi:hypothetical protein